MAIESVTSSRSFPSKLNDSVALSVSVGVLGAGLFAFNKVSNNGDKSARLNVPNRIDNNVAITYGIANLSIGFANDNKRK
ncbi:hypothetical protein GCM10011413_32140 [Pedobacter psychrotolerans]|uniref:Uncharacterized protein n=1 Tax=Pedobacter psychrotolerans TaxID=1843235 RepID=A0ABQ1STK8_9SPHI|nr:hypothetical protein GCM10011413_32140 [Pedobacter psychrotolerans]